MNKKEAEAAAPLGGILMLRIERVQEDIDRAIEGKRWSQLPGLAGILEGVTASLSVVTASVPEGREIGGKRAQRPVVELAHRVREHTARRFNEVPGADGRATDYLMGLKVVCDELGLAMLHDIRRIVAAAKHGLGRGISQDQSFRHGPWRVR